MVSQTQPSRDSVIEEGELSRLAKKSRSSRFYEDIDSLEHPAFFEDLQFPIRPFEQDCAWSGMSDCASSRSRHSRLDSSDFGAPNEGPSRQRGTIFESVLSMVPGMGGSRTAETRRSDRQRGLDPEPSKKLKRKRGDSISEVVREWVKKPKTVYRNLRNRKSAEGRGEGTIELRSPQSPVRVGSHLPSKHGDEEAIVAGSHTEGSTAHMSEAWWVGPRV